jgi:hypothetical protein
VRVRAARVALAAALAAALPLHAHAFGWGGNVGAMYTRLDERSGDFSSTSPRLDLDLALRLNGDVGGPGVFDWSAAGAYLLTRAETDGSSTSSVNTARYRLDGSLFRNRDSPLQLTAGVSRTDQNEKLGLESNQVGNYVNNSLSLGVDYLTPGRPQVVLGYMRSTSTSSLPGSPTTEGARDVYTASVNQGAGPFMATLRYMGDFSDGSFVADRYAQHDAGVDATVVMPSQYTLRMTDSYFLRKPTATEGDTYSLELQRFEAYLRGGALFGGLHEFRYNYLHSTSEAYGTLVDSMSQRLQYTADQPLRNPEYFLRGSARLFLSDNRVGAAAERTTGETVGAQLWWHRSTETASHTISGGPEIGFVQPTGGGNDLFYGVTANASSGIQRGIHALSGSYSLGYTSTDGSLGRWTLSQGLAGNVSRPLGTRTLSGQLTASAARSHDRTLGDSASRSLFASASLRGRAWSAELNASLNSTTSAVIPPGQSPGDGLLIPAPFDQHSATVRASADARLTPNLSGNVGFGLTSARGPGMPERTATETSAGLSYVFGALSLSLSDRYVTSDFLGGGRSNYLMVTLNRAFGQGR